MQCLSTVLPKNVVLIKLEPALLNYLHQAFYYIFSNLMTGGFHIGFSLYSFFSPLFVCL